jgi:hypothetical protein
MWVVTLLGMRGTTTKKTTNNTLAALENPGSADSHVLHILICISEGNTAFHYIPFLHGGCTLRLSVKWHDDEWNINWKDLEWSGCNLIKLLLWNFPGGTEENHDRPHLQYPNLSCYSCIFKEKTTETLRNCSRFQHQGLCQEYSKNKAGKLNSRSSSSGFPKKIFIIFPFFSMFTFHTVSDIMQSLDTELQYKLWPLLHVIN